MAIRVSRQFQWATRRPLRAGEFAVKTFGVQQEEDGILEIDFSAIGNHAWKLNVLMINRVP